MITECWIRERQIVDSVVAKKSKKLFGIIYAGIFLPSTSALTDTQTVKTPEAPVEIKRFSVEQKAA